MNPAEFDNIAATESTFWWYRGMEQMLWTLLDPHLGSLGKSNALEAGCGTGFLSTRLRKRYPHLELTSIDLDAKGLRYARRYGLSLLAQSNILALPFRDASFGLLLSMDVIAHLEAGQEHLAFAEFARVLKPGGLLRTSAFQWLRSRHSMHAHERQRYSRSHLLPVLAGNQFRPLRTTYANSLLLPVALTKFRLWEPLFQREPASGVTPIAPWLNSTLEQALKWECKWLERGGSFPVGQSLWLVASKTETK